MTDDITPTRHHRRQGTMATAEGWATGREDVDEKPERGVSLARQRLPHICALVRAAVPLPWPWIRWRPLHGGPTAWPRSNAAAGFPASWAVACLPSSHGIPRLPEPRSLGRIIEIK